MHFTLTGIFLLCFSIISFYETSGVSVTDYNTRVNGYAFILTPTPININPNIKIQTNTTWAADGDNVTVSWSGITPSKNNSDYIVLYTPGDLESVRTKVASKYLRISSLPGTFNQTGSGSYVFNLVSSRASWRFAYFQGSTLYPNLTALSNEINIINPNAPKKGHLTYPGRNDQVAVQWNTRDKTGEEVVFYGTSERTMFQWARPDYSTHFTPADLCGPVANVSGYVDPGYTHVVILRGLKPNTKYYYKYGSGLPGCGFSETKSFRSLNGVGPDEEVHFFATADVGSSEKDNTSLTQNEPASRQNMRWLLRDLEADDRYNLYHLHGDIAYADGQTTIWDNYFSEWSPFLEQIPAVYTEGNHERDYFGSGDRFTIAPGSTDGSGGECGVQTYFYFKLPVQFNGQKTNLWYSFDYGPIHFIHYSTERPVAKGTEQYQFMANDLARVDRRRTPWVIVGGHRPAYTASNYCCNNQPCQCTQDSDVGTMDILRNAFEELWYEYKVDLIWNGHVHRYERTCPVFNLTCRGYDYSNTANAPIYLNLGNGGYSLSRGIQTPYPTYYSQQGANVIFANGYTRLHVNRTTLVQEMVYASNGTLMDTLTLSKPYNWGATFMTRPTVNSPLSFAEGPAAQSLTKL